MRTIEIKFEGQTYEFKENKTNLTWKDTKKQEDWIETAIDYLNSYENGDLDKAGAIFYFYMNNENYENMRRNGLEYEIKIKYI